jgi:hypothetical protein
MSVLSAADVRRLPVTGAETNDWLLLGYDARITPHRPMVASVDSGVWPSVFDDGHVKAPAWTGPVQALWDDKERLDAVLRDLRQLVSVPILIIAVALLLKTLGNDAEEKWRRRMEDIRPSEVDAAWEFLGFDVADEYLESAIEVLVDHAAAGIQRYALNEWSLFDHVEEAERARDDACQSFPQRSAYCVYGVWEVR